MSNAPVMIVTGGSRGIGAAISERAAARGFDVAVNYRHDREAADQVVAAVEAHGRHALAVQADVSTESAVTQLFNSVVDHFGRLDALVNNAGIVDVPSRLVAMSAERIERMMSVNVVGPMLCAREAINHMSADARAGGSIVNIGSASSHAAGSGGAHTYVDYGASKGAIDTLTEGLACELAESGVRVNAVRPGVVDTEIHASGGQPDKPTTAAARVPLGRVGRPSDIADAVLYLTEAAFTTGALLDVDGGV
ncbi:glucose 1-dehydrogenase [Salinisphaera sp. USBA-960]|uniref:glucose 1-dehydrogenase n=1 Tax=Salinisphaera orenii TaxID=856731 RepID=UPI000DBE669C|nr:glucose 1-dehydrogenase [Salifodinibacter halophilus]NNC26736.1 glucose 1-dehydrogenase [Salifodinibacter halophilus]